MSPVPEIEPADSSAIESLFTDYEKIKKIEKRKVIKVENYKIMERISGNNCI